MINYLSLFSYLGELTFGVFLIFLYKKGSTRYPGKILKCKNDTDLHFFLLSFLLAYTLVLWLANLYTYKMQINAIWGPIYDEIVPEGGSPLVKWAWMSYFLLLLSFQLFKWRSAIKRIRRHTPIIKLQQKPSLMAYIREKRRQRKLRRAALTEPVFPQDLKIDLEKSNLQNEKDAPVTATEPTESTASILTSNSRFRRRRVHIALYSQWIHLIIVGYCLANRSEWNDRMSPFWKTYVDIVSLGYMVFFPTGWIETLITTIEAAVDQGEGERAEIAEGAIQI